MNARLAKPSGRKPGRGGAGRQRGLLGQGGGGMGRRGTRSRPQKSRLLVITEDTGSVYTYLQDLVRDWNLQRRVVIKNCQGKEMPSALQRFKRQVGKGREYDRAFCLIDGDIYLQGDAKRAAFLDNLTQCQEANSVSNTASKTKSSQARFVIIPSTPCFEVWFLLHFMPLPGPFSGRGAEGKKFCIGAEDRLRTETWKINKNRPYTKAKEYKIWPLIHDKMDQAIKHAACRANTSDPLPPARPGPNAFRNPSTAVHRLIGAIEALVDEERTA